MLDILKIKQEIQNGKLKVFVENGFIYIKDI